jgi:uncharacterized protein (DUF1499 family)
MDAFKDAGFIIGKKLGVLKKFAPLLGFYAVMYAPVYGTNFVPGTFLGSITDFATVRNRVPEGVIANEYILCPPDFCPKARAISPSNYNVPAADLLKSLDEVIRRQDRITVLDTSKEIPLKKEYVQRTLIFRFPDVITVQAIPLSPSKSTLAIHSYSIYGAGDLGVNANRVKTWVSELETQIPPSPELKTSKIYNEYNPIF